MTSSYRKRGRPTFRLVLYAWPKRTICGNLTSFIYRTCPRHLNLSVIIALKCWFEPHFLYSLLFEIRSVSQVTRTISRPYIWKTSSKSLSAVRSAHTSEPYLTTVIILPSNIQIIICRIIFLFFQTFSTVKNFLSLCYSSKIFTAPTVFANNTTKVHETSHLINIFVTQRQLFIFTYP